MTPSFKRVIASRRVVPFDSGPCALPLDTTSPSLLILPFLDEITQRPALLTFVCLCSGGSTGALLPYIESNYGINYARVSVLFVCTFIGYVVAAACTGFLSRRIGFGHTLCITFVVELMGVRPPATTNVLIFPSLNLAFSFRTSSTAPSSLISALCASGFL